MSQSKTHSMIEAFANVAIGYGISVVANLLVLPLFGYSVSVSDAAGMGLIFTAISIVRSYYVRRAFNFIHIRRADHG
jgi:hypothetical protein